MTYYQFRKTKGGYEMGAVSETHQFKETVHIPKRKLREIVSINSLDENDFRVFIYLLTILGGHNENKTQTDHKNFTKIDSEVIAEEIWMRKSEVKQSIKNLKKAGIIEKGDSAAAKGGYRFTF